MALLWQKLASWAVLSRMLGLVLLVAVALKGYEVATEELLEHSLLTSRWFVILIVEWQLFFALWLLGGFHRFYPRTTCGAALLYFFALFVVAMDDFLKGSPSCACFGKAMAPPWIAAAFDLAALLFLAAAPLPQPIRQTRQGPQWLGLAVVFSASGLLSLITMVDYSTSGMVPSIRGEPRFFGVVAIKGVRPTTEELLALLGSATGLNLTVDERLKSQQPDYGLWDLKAVQPWSVMELLVARQTVPARWEKGDEGYAMVPAARFGKSPLFWIGGGILLTLVMMGFRWLDGAQERKTRLYGDTDTETKPVAGLRTAKRR